MSVFRNGQPIPGSPFKVVVGQSEIGNASKVKAGGRGLTQGMANEQNEFFINTREAGQLSPSSSLLSPSHRRVMTATASCNSVTNNL